MPEAQPAFVPTLLGYKNLSDRQFAKRINVPRGWVLDHSNPGYSDDPIPHLQLGKRRRVFCWGSPKLAQWIERHVVSVYVAKQLPDAFAYEYLDSAELAARLGTTECWVRDQVRERADDPMPHVRFGKYVRFRWGSPELESWAEHRMLNANNRTVGRAQRKETVQ